MCSFYSSTAEPDTPLSGCLVLIAVLHESDWWACIIIVQRHEKNCFSHMHLRSLISTFVVCYLDSIIPIVAKSKISRL